MKIKYFGIAGEIMSNYPNIKMDNYGTVADLKNALLTQCNELNRIKGFMVAVNQEYASDDQRLNTGDEIAIIPPVSGG